MPSVPPSRRAVSAVILLFSLAIRSIRVRDKPKILAGAQSPPGNGDLFGLVVTPDGKGFYYVEDDMNTLMEASQ